MKGRALVVLSGGQDSVTCLYLAKQSYAEVHTLTFDYAQRHACEVDAARDIALMAGVTSHETLHLGAILQGTSPLVNPVNDVESYLDATSLPGGIEKTFVPMRNPLFLTIAANRAVVKGCSVIITGLSQEDYGGYPDCRSQFLNAMFWMIDAAIAESAETPQLHAPLMHLSKRQTVLLADSLPGCMDALAHSHTCYRGEFPPCGSCHACLLRERGFWEAGLVDPLMVRAAEAMSRV